MYIEAKGGGLTGPARIGRVSFSKSGRTIYYRGQEFRSLDGAGFKANFYDVATGAEYWISGPKKDGSDRLYGERVPVEIDDDVREEYWTAIRGQAHRVNESVANVMKHAKARVASVHVTKVADDVRVTVHDDGEGGVDPSQGTGIAGIRARVNAVDGSCSVTSPVGGSVQRGNGPVSPIFP